MSDGYPNYEAALEWASKYTMEDLHVMKDTKGVFHLFRHGEEELYRKNKLVPVAEITVDRQVHIFKNIKGKPVDDERRRGTHDGFRSVQEALDWAAERSAENLDVMKDKKGTLSLIRDGYQAHYRKHGGETVATIRLRSLVSQVLAVAPVQDTKDAAAEVHPVAQRRRRSP